MSQNVLTLDDLLNEVSAATLGKIDGILPAKVVSYDRTTQTVTLEIDSFKLRKNAGTGEVTSEKYPKLNNIPVTWFSARGFSFTTELYAGDRGFVLPCERSIDGWKATGNATEETFRRRFDHSDSIFLPVCEPPSDPLPLDAYASGGTVLKSENLTLDCAGDTTVLSGGVIRLGSATASSSAVRGDSLKLILNTLTTTLDNHAAALTASVTLANVIATGAALTADVTTLKALISAELYLQPDVKIK